jgi:hypothetical protein
MERRVGQHHADLAVPRGDALGDCARRPFREQHDRPFDRHQLPPLGRTDDADRLGVRNGPNHHGERFLVAALAEPQPEHRALGRRVAGEMEAADAFDRDDLSGDQLARGDGNWISCGVRLEPDPRGARREPDPRPTDGTRSRLRMKTAVVRILVLAAARVAHREAGHRRRGAVVGDIRCDREPGAAVRAVGERIPISAIGRIEDLAQAVVADRQIGRNRNTALRRLLAADDDEVILRFGTDRTARVVDNPRRGRRGGVERALEALERRRVAECIDGHAGGVVPDAAGYARPDGSPIDPRPEADALHDAANLNPTPRRCYSAHCFPPKPWQGDCQAISAEISEGSWLCAGNPALGPMMADNPSYRYGVLLWLLLCLFAFRVLAQAATLFFRLPGLPEFEAWHSAVLPYWLLFAAQIAILALLVWTARTFTTGAVRPRRWLGIGALALGALYFTTMLVRLALGLTVLRDQRWFSSRLPTVFHLVLAGYLIVFAWFHMVHAVAFAVGRKDRHGGSEP